jgi:hypothetical protein
MRSESKSKRTVRTYGDGAPQLRGALSPARPSSATPPCLEGLEAKDRARDDLAEGLVFNIDPELGTRVHSVRADARSLPLELVVQRGDGGVIGTSPVVQ